MGKIMGWLTGVFLSFWASKKAMAATGAVTGLSGAVVLIASAAYSDGKLSEHKKAQEQVNSRLERNLETMNKNMFTLQMSFIDRKKYELKELEKETNEGETK